MVTKIYKPYQPNADDIAIMRLLAGGETVGDIAPSWGKNPHAMATRVHRLREALEVDTNEEMIARAFREKWIE